GVRAGRPTVQYLEYVISRVTFVGSLYLGLIAMIPLIAFVLIGADQNFPFGGTSILIMVGVALNTIKQIDAQMEQQHHEGLRREAASKTTQLQARPGQVMAHLLIMGPPGSGKGPQAVRIADKMAIPAISTGDICRYNVKEHTELGKE